MPIPAPPIADIVALIPEMMITVAACALLVADVLTRRQYKQWLGWGGIAAIVLTLLVMMLMPPSAGAVSDCDDLDYPGVATLPG